MFTFISTWESQFYLFHKNSLLSNTIFGSISWQFCSKTLILLIYCFLWDLFAYKERSSWHIQVFLVDMVGTFSPDSLFIKTWLHLSGNGRYPSFSLFLLHRWRLPSPLAPRYPQLDWLSWTLHSPHTVLLQGPGYPGRGAAQWSRDSILRRWLRVRPSFEVFVGLS